MRFMRLVVALSIGIGATHILAPEVAVWVLGAAILVGIGPVVLAKFLLVVFMIMRAVT